MTCTETGHLAVVAVMTSKVYFSYHRHELIVLKVQNDQLGVLFSAVAIVGKGFNNPPPPQVIN